MLLIYYIWLLDILYIEVQVCWLCSPNVVLDDLHTLYAEYLFFALIFCVRNLLNSVELSHESISRFKKLVFVLKNARDTQSLCGLHVPNLKLRCK